MAQYSTGATTTMDTPGFFENPYREGNMVKFSREECLTNAETLVRKCHAQQREVQKMTLLGPPPSFGTLYKGTLGTDVFVPWKLARVYRNLGQTTKAQEILHDTLARAELAVRAAAPVGRQKDRVTLLESPLIGAKALQIAIWGDLQRTVEAKTEADSLCAHLLTTCQALPPSECDVLYGRAGALQTILFLRRALGDPYIGQPVALSLAEQILREGQEYGAQHSQYGLSLLWKWHETIYLGAAHGVVGILHTLLCLEQQELDILQENLGIRQQIQRTIEALSQFTWSSGNLSSSVKSSLHQTNKLVQWCHGATGHIILLIKAFTIFGKEEYKQQATDVAQNVVWTRGLLRKGVGLCHGISGNAYALLAVARHDPNKFWLLRTHSFARFAWDNLEQLEGVPDEPYSLYTGLGGLSTLFLDLLEEDSCPMFPLYDHPPVY